MGSKRKITTWLTLSQRVMGSKREANYLAYFVTKSNEFEKVSEIIGLLCHSEYWVQERKRSIWLTLLQRVMGSKRKPTTWLTLSQRVMGSKKGSEVLGLLCHKE